MPIERTFTRSVALPPPARLISVSARPSTGGRVVRQTIVLDDAADRPDAIDEPLFRGVLSREQKRADRSNLSAVLFLVRANAEVPAGAPVEWRTAIEALAGVKRETDVLGWFERGRVLGVICPEIEASAVDVAQALDARFRRELAKRLGADALRKLSITPYVHPEPKVEDAGFAARIAPFPSSDARPRSQGYDVMKRWLDVIGSVTLLSLLSPLMLLVAALVKLTSSGPVFFRQVRVGQHMKPFEVLKFRTMHVHADSAIHQEFVSSFIKSSGKAGGASPNGFFKIVSDPRITRIGNFLRKTSLDELPQFWNVLRGDMSLVGPRPPIPYEVRQYQRWHCRRVLEAKPGITGLWQVTGRSRTTFDEMVRLDLRYAKSRSLLTDLKILLATPKAVVAGRGAC